METPFNPYWFLDQRKLIRGIFLNQNKQNLKTGKQTNRERPIGQNNLIQNKIEIWETDMKLWCGFVYIYTGNIRIRVLSNGLGELLKSPSLSV